MDITPVVPKGNKIINAYGDGGFTVSNERFEGSLIVMPEMVLPWAVNGVAELSENDFAPLLTLHDKPEILLIGTGALMKALSPIIRGFLREQGISVDAMDTGAACRTYNVLAGEGRIVAAALVAI